MKTNPLFQNTVAHFFAWQSHIHSIAQAIGKHVGETGISELNKVPRLAWEGFQGQRISLISTVPTIALLALIDTVVDKALSTVLPDGLQKRRLESFLLSATSVLVVDSFFNGNENLGEKVGVIVALGTMRAVMHLTARFFTPQPNPINETVIADNPDEVVEAMWAKIEIKRMSLEPKEFVYMIPISWWRRWGAWAFHEEGARPPRPGRITTVELMDGSGKLLPHLRHGVDYVEISDVAYVSLANHHGTEGYAIRQQAKGSRSQKRGLSKDAPKSPFLRRLLRLSPSTRPTIGKEHGIPLSPLRMEMTGATDARQSLHFAAKNGDVAAINALIKAGVAVKAADIDGFQPLHAAAEYGRVDASTLS